MGTKKSSTYVSSAAYVSPSEDVEENSVSSSDQFAETSDDDATTNEESVPERVSSLPFGLILRVIFLPS